MMASFRDARRASLAATLRNRISGSVGPGAVSFLFATAGVSLSNFLFHVVISRLLGPSHYGGLSALLNVTNLLGVPLGALQLAVTQAVVQGRSAGRECRVRRLALLAVGSGLFCAAVLVVLAPTLTAFLHLGSSLPVTVLAAWLPLATTSAVLEGALIGELRFMPVAIATFLSGGPVRLVLGVGLVLIGGGMTGAVAATVAAAGVLTGLLAMASRRSLAGGGEQLQLRLSDTALSVVALSGYTALT